MNHGADRIWLFYYEADEKHYRELIEIMSKSEDRNKTTWEVLGYSVCWWEIMKWMKHVFIQKLHGVCITFEILIP